jgi:NADH:ubiquinone oxidoreductase subunit E
MPEQAACGRRDIPADDERFAQLQAFIDSLAGAEGITMPVLQEAQRIFGYLPPEVQKFIAAATGTPIAEIYGVATFYSQFHTTLKGKHKVGVCLGTACYVRGTQAVLEKVCEELGIGMGETTADGQFTIEDTRCLGCCSLAPVMVIDDKVYGKLDDVGRIAAILQQYRV